MRLLRGVLVVLVLSTLVGTAFGAESRLLPDLLQGGASTVAGDFNGDGADDLAIGVPGEDIGTARDAGAVHVLYGGRDGLAAAGDVVLHQNVTDVISSAERSDLFGAAVAAGDLNADGYDDLAVGAPGEDTPVAPEGGAVNVFYGGPDGVRAAGSDRFWVRDLDESKYYDSHGGTGWRLAIGDFVGQGTYYENDYEPDGFDDLAIAVPRLSRILAGHIADGGVVIYPGSTQGVAPDWLGSISKFPEKILVLAGDVDAFNLGHAMDVGDFNGDEKDDLAIADATGVVRLAQRSIYQGPDTYLEDGQISDVAAGDFDGDGFSDLAVGSADEDVGSATDAGITVVHYGRSEEESVEAREQIWHQGSPFVEGAPEEGDNFGRTLESADFNGDGYTDLAVGSPRECLKLCPSPQGAVNVLYGSSDGLTALRDQLWSKGSAGVLGAVARDRFGSSLAAGDFDDDGYGDLAITSPDEIVSGMQRAGATNVLYGSASGITAAGNSRWHQDVRGIGGSAEAGDVLGGPPLFLP